MAGNNNLPALAEQNKQFEEIKSMIDKLAQMPRPTLDNPNDNPLYIDYRKIDAFMTLQNAYYNIFAQQKVSLEYVPYAIISKSIKWTEKSYKKDLKMQVNNKYKKLIKVEKRAKRALKIKQFFKKLLTTMLAPFKLIFNGIRFLLKKLFIKKNKNLDCELSQSAESMAENKPGQAIEPTTADVSNLAVENEQPEQNL